MYAFSPLFDLLEDYSLYESHIPYILGLGRDRGGALEVSLSLYDTVIMSDGIVNRQIQLTSGVGER